MPPKVQAKTSKKDPKVSKPKKDGGGKAKKKKWSKGKVRDKLNNACFFDKATYDKFVKEIPQSRLITPSSVSERMKIRVSLARAALNELVKQGTLRQVSCHHAQQIYVSQNYCLETPDLFLVPYEAGHVPKYHRWMETKELLKLTASDALTLEEEFQQQQNWLVKEDRVTFILLEKSRLPAHDLTSLKPVDEQHFRSLKALVRKSPNSKINDAEVEAMIGDVNFYLIPDPESESDDVFEGEVAVMIAEPSSRGKGLATQALAGALLYVENFFPHNVSAVVAKISLDNEISLRFFQNKLGFIERKRNACFNEAELVCPPSKTGGSAIAQAAWRAIAPLQESGKQWIFRVFDVTKFRSCLFSSG